MTFSEYIIEQKSEKFYFTSLEQMVKCKSTLEDWFENMYYDYKILHLLQCKITENYYE